MHLVFLTGKMNKVTGGLIFIVTAISIILFVLIIDWCVKRKLRRYQRPSYSYVLQHNDSSDSEFDDDNKLV